MKRSHRLIKLVASLFSTDYSLILVLLVFKVFLFLFPSINKGNLSNQSLVLTEGREIEINEFVSVFQVYRDTPPNQVWESIQNGELIPMEEKANIGMQKDSDFWLYFELENQTSSNEKILEIRNPQLDYIALYELGLGNPNLLIETGDQFVFNQRPIKNRHFLLPLDLEQRSTSAYLLKLSKENSALKFPMRIYDASLYPSVVASNSIVFGIYFGILFLVSLISLVISLFVRKRVFLVYGLYVFFFSMWFFSKEGFSYQYITSDFPQLNTHFYPIFTSLASMFLILYVQTLFSTRTLIPRFNRLMNLCVGIFIGGFVLWILFPDAYLRLAPELFALRYVILVTSIVFAYTSSIKSLKVSPLRSKLFLFGYTTFFLGIFSELGSEYGILNLHAMTIPPIMIGYLVEVFALSVAMGSIMYGTMQQRDELLETNLNLQRTLETLEEEQNQTELITLKSKAVLNPDKIRYIQSDDHYLEFYMIDKDLPEVDRNTLSNITNLLPGYFAQIHRSTIVNLRHVKAIYSDRVQLRGGEELRVSRTYKQKIEKKLNS